MNINFWMIFWKITLIISISVFVLMFFYVSIKGFKELKNLFLGQE